MVADVRRLPMDGGKQDDLRPPLRASISYVRSFPSSPLAFGDGKSNLRNINKSKGRGTSLVIDEGAYLEKKEPEVIGKGNNVILENDFKNIKSVSVKMFVDGHEASPSN